MSLARQAEAYETPGVERVSGWAIKWRSESRIDGKREFLRGRFHSESASVPECLSGYITMVFATREQARKFKREHYGYIRNSPDLRAEPHGWKMPQVVKVNVIVEEVAG